MTSLPNDMPKRPIFYSGQLLSDQALTLLSDWSALKFEQAGRRDGWGVLWGLVPRPQTGDLPSDKIEVSPGEAVDGAGNSLVVPKPLQLDLARLVDKEKLEPDGQAIICDLWLSVATVTGGEALPRFGIVGNGGEAIPSGSSADQPDKTIPPPAYKREVVVPVLKDPSSFEAWQQAQSDQFETFNEALLEAGEDAEARQRVLAKAVSRRGEAADGIPVARLRLSRHVSGKISVLTLEAVRFGSIRRDLRPSETLPAPEGWINGAAVLERRVSDARRWLAERGVYVRRPGPDPRPDRDDASSYLLAPGDVVDLDTGETQGLAGSVVLGIRRCVRLDRQIQALRDRLDAAIRAFIALMLLMFAYVFALALVLSGELHLVATITLVFLAFGLIVFLILWGTRRTDLNRRGHDR